MDKGAKKRVFHKNSINRKNFEKGFYNILAERLIVKDFLSTNQNFVKNYSNKVPMRRMGLPKDIAPSIAFLLSDDANYITGHNLMVDGGWSCI